MTVGEQNKNLPWVEKYRPSKLEDLVSHNDIIKTINHFMKENQLPHLLFYGPPGTGKTSTILACAKQMYTPQQFNSMVLELNASDDRGIGIVRGQILSFASTRTIFKAGPKLIILDEADAMTNDAQNALRRIIEKYTDNVRFCIICNYLGKIIPALQSRCTRFRFAPLQQSQIVPRVKEIADTEGVKMTEDGLKALLTLSGGDMRKVLNTLQSTWLAYHDVTEDKVYTCVGHPLRSDINNIVNWLLNENDFSTCFQNIQDLKIAKGLALGDILTEVHKIIQRFALLKECRGENDRVAVAHLSSRNVTGTINFTETAAGVQISGTITGMPDGLFGFHVHELGDTSTCDTAGAHFNPDNNLHGGPDHDERHVGDLGNVIFTSGIAEFNFVDRQISLRGRNNILGRTLVLHEREDDLGLGEHEDSLTTGNAGARVACAVIGIRSGDWRSNAASGMVPSAALLTISAIFYSSKLLI